MSREAFGDRLFRALVRLLPEELRGPYAADMEATFRAEQRDALRSNRWSRLAALWLATIADVVRTAPAEHLDVLARDLRFALRTMAGRPAHTLTAILQSRWPWPPTSRCSPSSMRCCWRRSRTAIPAAW